MTWNDQDRVTDYALAYPLEQVVLDSTLDYYCTL